MREISSVRTLGRIARAPGGIAAATCFCTASSRLGSTSRSIRSSSPSLPNSSCAVAMSTNTTLESMPVTPRGTIPAMRSVTSRSPASARTAAPCFQPKRSAIRALTNAPCPSTTTLGSVPRARRCPARPPRRSPPPGSGRSRSMPSTRRISPENGSPGLAPTVSASSIVGPAELTPGMSCTRTIARSSKPRPTPEHLQVDVARDHVDARGERGHRGRVGQVDRQADRHPQRDGDQRHERAQGVGAELAQHERAKERGHARAWTTRGRLPAPARAPEQPDLGGSRKTTDVSNVGAMVAVLRSHRLAMAACAALALAACGGNSSQSASPVVGTTPSPTPSPATPTPCRSCRADRSSSTRCKTR